MKNAFLFLINSIALLFSLSGCLNFYPFQEQSLILNYYQGPLNWAGIILGQSTMAEVKESLNNMGEIQNDSFREGEFFSRSEIAICAEIDKRFREDSVCIWFVDDRAQYIDFFGDDLTLDEIQTHLGELEKLAIYTDIRGPFRIIEFKGFSLQSGYIARNILKSKRGDKLPENITIKKNTVLVVDFINPDFFDVFYGKGSALWNFLFEEGGFEDWHGYGMYDVKDVTFLDY